AIVSSSRWTLWDSIKVPKRTLMMLLESIRYTDVPKMTPMTIDITISIKNHPPLLSKLMSWPYRQQQDTRRDQKSALSSIPLLRISEYGSNRSTALNTGLRQSWI